MKKQVSFFALTFLILSFFACDLGIKFPKEIVIKGSPQIVFAAKINFGDMLMGFFEEAIKDLEEVDVFPCVNTENHTYIAYINLFTESLNLGGVIPDDDLFPGITIPDYITMSQEETLYKSAEIELPLSALTDNELLNGFSLNNMSAKLYFSGEGTLIQKVKIELIIDGVAGDEYDINTSGISGSGSINFDDDKYTGTKLPDGGVEIPFTPGANPTVQFRAFVPLGAEITEDDFTTGQITAELLVWIPLELTALAEGTWELLDLSKTEDGSPPNDLFGRPDPEGNDEVEGNVFTDIISYLELEVALNKSPFPSGTEININSTGGFNITGELEGNSIKIIAANLDDLNDPQYYPFAPSISLTIPPGDLVLPRDFRTTSIAVKADIKFNIPLQKEEEEEEE